VSSKVTARLWHTGLLAIGLAVGCGKSSSHQQPDMEPVSPAGGASDEPSEEPATGGGTAAPIAGTSGASSAGGTSLGGAASGGTSQDLGGSPDAGAAPSLMLPPGCEPRTPMESADICSLAVDCDTAPSVRTYCHRLDSDQWECQCAFQEQMYRVENAAGLQACALAARLCSDQELELGPESCEHSSDRSDLNSCGVDFSCTKPVKLDDAIDAQAWAVRFGSARCIKYEGSASFACSCVDGTVTQNYQLVADSGEQACGPLADFCMSGQTPDFQGKETCLPGFSSSDDEGCQRSASCGLRAALADDVSLVSLVDRYASCTPRAGGGSECSCSERDTAFLFDLATAPDDASCQSAISNCDPNAVIEPTAAASCKPLNADASSVDSCYSFSTCDQNATVDGRKLVAHGNLILSCRRTEAGQPWWCSCASGPDTSRFQLGAAGANAAQACSQGSTACLERMGLHLGPSGDPMEPPDPL